MTTITLTQLEWQDFSKKPPYDELVLVYADQGIHLRSFRRGGEGSTAESDEFDDNGIYDDSETQWELWCSVPELVLPE